MADIPDKADSGPPNADHGALVSVLRHTFRIGARGFVIGDLQRALERALGRPIEGGVDERFGSGTADAVTELQDRHDIKAQARGEAGVDEFNALGLYWPSDFERCLQLTAAFEGTDFGIAEGPHETGSEVGVTFGIAGFTSFNGELQSLLRDISAVATPEAGPRLSELAARILGATGAADFAHTIDSQAPNELFAKWALDSTGRVFPGIARLLAEIGKWPEMRAAQLSRAGSEKWALALKQGRTLFSHEGGAPVSVRPLALCFDIVVQNGGLRPAEIEKMLALGDKGEAARMRQIIDVLRKRFAGSEDADEAMARKLTITTGSGTVHGDRYRLDSYAL